jgi:hypothetical protein
MTIPGWIRKAFGSEEKILGRQDRIVALLSRSLLETEKMRIEEMG